MKDCNVVILAILLALLSSIEIYSQDDFEFHLGVANPLLEFASDDVKSDKAGGAGIGFTIGLKYTNLLTENGLGLFAGLDFCLNGLKTNVRDEIESTFEESGIRNAYYTFSKFYYLPISAGLNYITTTNGSVSIFVNAGITYNLLKVSDLVVDVNQTKVTSRYDLTNGFGVKIGGGIYLNKKATIGLNYLGLGKHDINGDIDIGGLPTEEIEEAQKIDVLTITLGLNF